MKLIRATVAAGGFGVAAVAVYMAVGLSHHAPAAAASSPQGMTRVASDRVRYPAGSPQLSFLAIRSMEPTPLPALEPLPAKLAYDENHTVRVFSPLAGRAAVILAQPGDHVAPQQVLAWIESPDFGTAVADLRKAQADDEVKQAALKRAGSLYDAGVIAQRELEAAQADAKTSRAELDRASTRLRELGKPNEQGRYAVRAPFGGVIAERHLNPGQEVRPDATDPLFVITDPRQLDVVADVPESAVARLGVGQAVMVDTDDQQLKAVMAKISNIGVAVDANTRRVPVRAHLVDPPAGARPELFVRFTAVDEHSPLVLAVPNGAIVASGVQSYVFVEQEPGLLVKRPVQFARRGRDVSYVQSGIQRGDRLVTQGALLVDADLAGGN